MASRTQTAERRTDVGVYFVYPTLDIVWVGHYNQNHREMTAAESVAEFDGADDAQGWEVVVPRRIEPKEIHKVRTLRRLLGGDTFPMPRASRHSVPASFAPGVNTARVLYANA